MSADVAWQERRLAGLGVDVGVQRTATADDVVAANADVVVARGVKPRRPDVPGVDIPFVVQGTDVMRGAASVGERGDVEHVASLGGRVFAFYQTPQPAPLVGKYTLGGIFDRLDTAGVELRLGGVEESRELRFAHVYSGRAITLDGFDSVVLACGGASNNALYHTLDGRVPARHLLGDATRQALDLAGRL